MRVVASKKIMLINKFNDKTLTEDDLKNYGYTEQQLRRDMFFYKILGKRALCQTQTKWAERKMDEFIEREARYFDMETSWKRKHGYA